LRDIVDRDSNNQFLEIRQSSRSLIINQGNLCIPIRFFQTGRDGYPDNFVPPEGHHFRKSEHNDLQATYRDQWLPVYPHDTSVPVLRFDLLLRQRLLQFEINEHSLDPLVKRQNRRDIDDIRVFRRLSVPHEKSFPGVTDSVLLPIFKRWIKYARKQAIPIQHPEVKYSLFAVR